MTRKDEIPEIAKRIKQLRKAKGWTQPKLAQEAKVTDGAVKMWETGKRFPRGANLRNLAAALGVPESSILDDTPPPVRASELTSPDAQDFKDLIAILPALDKHEINFLLGQARTFLAVKTSDPQSLQDDPKLKNKG